MRKQSSVPSKLRFQRYMTVGQPRDFRQSEDGHLVVEVDDGTAEPPTRRGYVPLDQLAAGSNPEDALNAIIDWKRSPTRPRG